MLDHAFARFLPILILLAGPCVAGCEDEPTSTAASRQDTTADTPEPAAEPGAPTASEDAGLPDDPLLRTLHRRAVEHAPKMIPAQAPFEATVQQGRSREILAVLTGGLCYKIIGVGGDGVESLDLTLLDPNHVPAQHVSGDDRVPLLGIQEPICPQHTGSYQIRIQAHGEAGRYAVGVYRSKL